MTFDTAQTSLAGLLDQEKVATEPRNEATTRLQIIDVLLFDCLGWDRRDAIAEAAHNGQYVDYALGRPHRFAIWEAKKEGNFFTLPTGLKGGIHKLGTLLSGEQGIADAIRQVLRYCQDRSVAIAVVCNGHQIVAFLANRQDNVPPLEGRCLVFTSLEEIQSRFREFWDNLSFVGSEARNLQKTLQADGIKPPPERLALRTHGYPGFKNRNPFQENLRTLAELFIEDLGNIPKEEDEFLRACYASSGALSQFALISRNILRTRYASSQSQELRVDTISASSKDGASPHLLSDLLSKGLHRRPIVLLGDVGVGKTIFLRNLLKIEAKAELQRAVVFYIDFLKEPAFTDDLSHFIMRRCRELLLEHFKIDVQSDNFVRGVYHEELQRFAAGIEGKLKLVDPVGFTKSEIAFLREKLQDKATHLQRCIEHLAHGQNRLIVLCLDNIDQRPTPFQEEVYSIGHSLAQTWPANVFISLRPDTFYHSRSSGVMAAYQPRVFTVSPPRLDEVIYKRLQYAIDQLTETGRVSGIKTWLTVDASNLLTYLKTLLDSFKESSDLMESLDNMSAGNIREAIRFVISFIGSGHVDAQKIIRMHENKGQPLAKNASDAEKSRHFREAMFAARAYVIPVHEFMRAVIYGDHIYYDPSSSPVYNLFDLATADPKEHFLSLNILGLLERNSTSAEGFVDITKIFEFTQGLGLEPYQVHAALDRLVSKRLIEPNPRLADTVSKTAFRVTTVGMYALAKLVHWFVYVDAVVIDTPILDDMARNAIGVADTIEQRALRAREFVRYLDMQWDRVDTSTAAFDWKAISKHLYADISRAEAAAERGRRRSADQNVRSSKR